MKVTIDGIAIDVEPGTSYPECRKGNWRAILFRLRCAIIQN